MGEQPTGGPLLDAAGGRQLLDELAVFLVVLGLGERADILPRWGAAGGCAGAVARIVVLVAGVG